MSRSELIEHLIYAVRCVASGLVAYVLADRLGLEHPVWATMSSLVVSQESFNATRGSIAGRLLGTAIGVLVSLTVYELLSRVNPAPELQLTLAVGVCALLAKGRPTIRCCMWTCPIVLLTATPQQSVEVVGLLRGSEVMLGALVGGVAHWLEYQTRRNRIS